MRETFNSLSDLMAFYRYLKSNVTSQGSPIPHKIHDIRSGEWYQMPPHFNAWAARKSMEDKFVFIGEVEKYVHHYEKSQGGWRPIGKEELLHIFHLKFLKKPGMSDKEVLQLCRYSSYGHMALAMKNRRLCGEMHIPARLIRKQNLFFIADAMAQKAEEYFTKKGMIEEVKNEMSEVLRP